MTPDKARLVAGCCRRVGHCSSVVGNFGAATSPSQFLTFFWRAPIAGRAKGRPTAARRLRRGHDQPEVERWETSGRVTGTWRDRVVFSHRVRVILHADAWFF